MATYLPSKKSSKYDELDMWDNAVEARKKSLVMFFYGPPHKDVSVLADQ